ncbi:MAG TPA: DUF885 domain-containing protein [Steroidobacteraceae bacterium]|nr:DUF885 domain-containing protein [Steroidobacteraceae bacterium]
MRTLRVLTALVVLLLAACGEEPKSAAAPAAPAPGDAAFANLEREYVVFFLWRNPVVATYLGGSALNAKLSTVDSRLRDYSEDGLADEDLQLEEFQKQFDVVHPGDLSPRRRIDRDVALAQIRFQLHQHKERKYQQRSIDSYVDEPFRGVDFQLQSLDHRDDGSYGYAQDWARIRERIDGVAQYLINARRQLDAGIKSGNTPDWRLIVAYGIKSARADAEYFQNEFPAIALKRMGGQNRETRLAAITGASHGAAESYRQFADWVAKAYFVNPKGTDAAAMKPAFRADRYVFGEEEYNWALKNNLRLEKTAAQLYEEASPVVEATQKEMITLATEIAKARGLTAPDGGAVVRAVFDELSKDAPKSDDEMIGWYRDTGARIVQYARDTDLFDVPKDYKLEVTVTPAALRSSIDGAAYYTAPPFKTGGVGKFYVTPTDNDLAKLREGHYRAKIADLAAHEGFPGHDWNYRVMTQNREEISLVRWLTPGAVEDSSSMWADSLAAEGWALYSEALLAEPQPKAKDGFYTPEEHLLQLRGKLYRDLRVRLDTGLHTGKLTIADAADLYSEVVDFLPGKCGDKAALKVDAKRASCDEAGRAIQRYARWPTQAICYRLGKEQILALRQRAQTELGDKFSAKQFHVEYMKQGTIAPGYFGDELIARLKALN